MLTVVKPFRTFLFALDAGCSRLPCADSRAPDVARLRKLSPELARRVEVLIRSKIGYSGRV